MLNSISNWSFHSFAKPSSDILDKWVWLFNEASRHDQHRVDWFISWGLCVLFVWYENEVNWLYVNKIMEKAADAHELIEFFHHRFEWYWLVVMNVFSITIHPRFSSNGNLCQTSDLIWSVCSQSELKYIDVHMLNGAFLCNCKMNCISTRAIRYLDFSIDWNTPDLRSQCWSSCNTIYN